MSDPLDALERSILSSKPEDDTKKSLTERHPHLYIAVILVLSLLATFFLFSIPIIALYLVISIPSNIIAASDYLDATIILTQISVATIATILSYYLFKLNIDLPAGRPLSNEDSASLIALVNEICDDCNAPKIDFIKLTNICEIEIIRTPTNGFPVLFTNTLLIGLPLMQSLSPIQLKAAIYRKIIHLTGTYKRPTAWIYFYQKTLSLYKKAHSKQWQLPNIFMLAFFSWFTPVFRLLAQAACRQEELYADAAASQAMIDNSIVNMLTTSSICKKYLEENYWPHLFNKAYKYKSPPYFPYSSLERNLRINIDRESAQSWLDHELQTENHSNFMPSLRTRFENLGHTGNNLPEPVTESSAHHFLNSSLAEITKQMDKVWFITHRFDWQQKYKKGQLEQNLLKEYRIQASKGLLSDTKIWEYILLIKRYVDEPEASELYKQILKYNPRDPRISFDIGRTLIAKMDDSGIEALENTIKLDSSFTVMACQLITKYYVRAGNNKAAQSYRRQALAYQVEAA
ncbi:MAG: hypothetical protein OQL06_10200 [Gammaproteobacteria bacterium]|nr:hypothetical protein [Gammaproteobacteria bacterium]